VAGTISTTAYHQDGNIDLRDPDGAGQTPITNIAGAAFTFQRFSTSYAAGSRTATGHTANTIDNVITQKFCLACHDSNGATNPTARSTATSTAAMPFGGIALGTNYTAANNAIGTQGTIDVKTQLATTNSSRHPVLGPRTRDFPYSTRLAAPYNNIGTTRDANGTTGHTTAASVVINCFDCHNTPAPLTTRTIVSHGNAVTLRGTIYALGAVSTLCSTCHIGYTVSGTHSTGSAWAATGSSHNVSRNCQDCHGSYKTAAPVRPVRAQDYHGNNALVGGGLWPTVNSRPYAFIRAWSGTAYHRPYRSSEFTTGSATCGAGTCPSGGSGGQVGDGSTRTYTAGGTY
jgi:nitrate/TMAO reductase-like tetraheme cytochrome c subunit